MITEKSILMQIKNTNCLMKKIRSSKKCSCKNVIKSYVNFIKQSELAIRVYCADRRDNGELYYFLKNTNKEVYEICNEICSLIGNASLLEEMGKYEDTIQKATPQWEFFDRSFYDIFNNLMIKFKKVYNNIYSKFYFYNTFIYSFDKIFKKEWHEITNPFSKMPNDFLLSFINKITRKLHDEQLVSRENLREISQIKDFVKVQQRNALWQKFNDNRDTFIHKGSYPFYEVVRGTWQIADFVESFNEIVKSYLIIIGVCTNAINVYMIKKIFF